MEPYTRRDFLKALAHCGVCASAVSLIPRSWTSVAEAQGGGSVTHLIMLMLSGGYDSLGVFQPSGYDAGDALQAIRPTLYDANPSTTRVQLGATHFWAHSTLTEFAAAYAAGQLAFIPGAAPLNPTRGHDTAQLAWRTGADNMTNVPRSGVLGRAATVYGFTDPMMVIDVTGGSDATELGTNYIPAAVPNFGSFGFNTNVTASDTYRTNTMYSCLDYRQTANDNAAREAVFSGWTGMRNTATQVAAAQNITYPNAYGASAISKQMKGMEAAIATQTGKAVFGYAEMGGFDTHGSERAVFTSILPGLNDAIKTFRANMAARGISNYLIVIGSDFARTNGENGTQGTDHGISHTSIVISPQIKGGLYEDVTLADIQSKLNAVPPKVNTVDILWECFALTGYDPSQVFPGHVPNLLGFSA